MTTGSYFKFQLPGNLADTPQQSTHGYL